MNMKSAAIVVLLLFGSFPLSIAERPEGHGPDDPVVEGEEKFTVSDVGGGGWLHSGTFHPDPDPDNLGVIVVGSDYAGGIYRTDNFGVDWTPWNEGLSNDDQMLSMYVEDLIGVVEPGGTAAFYAATHGGIYRRPSEGGEWTWMAGDQPRDENDAVDPDISMVYWRKNDVDVFGDYRAHREPISFSCLDWNGRT